MLILLAVGFANNMSRVIAPKAGWATMIPSSLYSKRVFPRIASSQIVLPCVVLALNKLLNWTSKGWRLRRR
jgi:hypothetical protein